MFVIHQATRTKSKIRVGLFGPSGSGKTYSALLLASGLTSWDKICVIDTERSSSNLYAHLGPYSVLELAPPYDPRRYIQAIEAAEQAGFEAIIIDSISHEWEGEGGCLQLVESGKSHNSFTNWKDVTPLHNRFIDKIIVSPAHVICCGRAKTEYVINESNGKKVPEKIGLKAVTRENFDYEMTVAFDLSRDHVAHCSKDRTGMFLDNPPITITQRTGEQILDWVMSGADPSPLKVIKNPTTELLESINELMKEGRLKPDDVKGITGYQTLKGLPLEDLEKVHTALVDYVADITATA